MITVGERKRKENQTEDTTTHVGTTFNVSEFVYLQIVPINIKGKNGKSVTILLDNGAQSMLIRRDMATSLGLTQTKGD